MEIKISFNHLSLTHLRQERSVIYTILAQAEYSEDYKQVNIPLYKFEGKHFRAFSKQQLVLRVKEVSIRLKRLKIINNYSGDKDFLCFNLGTGFNKLENYLSLLNKAIEKKETDEGLINKQAWFKVKEEDKSFILVLLDGDTRTISFRSKSGNNLMFEIFKVLFEQWRNFPTKPVISKAEIKEKFRGKGIDDVSDFMIKNTVGNIRKFKIKSTPIEGYLSIKYVKQIGGYQLHVKRTK